MLLRFLLFLASAVYVTATGTTTKPLSSSTTSPVKCSTTMATTSAKGSIPTSSSTTILKAQIILLLTTYAPTTTRTPKAITVTTVAPRTTTTTKTDSTVTGTFSTTQTSTSVVTSLTTTTVVSTTTVSSTTSSTSTVIVPNTAGFVNADQSTGEMTLQQKRDLGQIEAAKPEPKIKRSLNEPYSGLIKRTNQPSKTYPFSVKFSPAPIPSRPLKNQLTSASRCQISPDIHHSHNNFHQACHDEDSTSAHIDFNFLQNSHIYQYSRSSQRCFHQDDHYDRVQHYSVDLNDYKHHHDH